MNICIDSIEGGWGSDHLIVKKNDRGFEVTCETKPFLKPVQANSESEGLHAMRSRIEAYMKSRFEKTDG